MSAEIEEGIDWKLFERLSPEGRRTVVERVFSRLSEFAGTEIESLAKELEELAERRVRIARRDAFLFGLSVGCLVAVSVALAAFR